MPGFVVLFTRRNGRFRLKEYMSIPQNNHSVLPWIVATAAAILLLLLINSIAYIPEASAADAGITIGTDKLVYSSADTINFDVALDASGQTLSGDLLLRVYPPASPSSADPFGAEALVGQVVAEGVTVAGTGNVSAAIAISDLGLGSGGYPARMILTADGEELLAGDVWLTVVDPSDAAPIDLVLLWTVGGPPQRNAQDEFISNSLVDRCRNEPLTGDSILQHEIIAREYPTIKTTYAIEGLLLDELLDITDGYVLVGEDGTVSLDATSLEAVNATNCIDSLRELPTYDNVDIISTPYTFADLTLLARQGWNDGTGQYRLGHDILTETLLLPTVPKGTYVPQLNLTTDSLRYIAATGGEYSVLGGYVRSAIQARDEAAVSHRMRDLSGERLTGFFADDDISGALLGGTPDVDAFFAGLANAYVSGNQLAIAAAAVSNPGISTELRSQVYSELARQQWINSITLTEANEKYRPDSEPATLLRYVDSASGYITRMYYTRMEEVHEMFEDYRAAVDSEEPQMVRLTKLMFAAESNYWFNASLGPDAANNGLEMLDEIERMVTDEIGGLEIDIDTPLMQVSSSGKAKVTITNNNPYTFTVELSLIADDDVSFPEGSSRELRVESGVTQVEIPYDSSSWSDIDAQLSSRGNILVSDDAGIRLLNARFLLAMLLITALLAGGIAYYIFVIRRVKP